MMGTVVFLGIPATYVKRFKLALPKCEALAAWTFEYVPSQTSKAEIPARALILLKEVIKDNETIHIFGLSVQQNRQEFADKVRKHFRFRWFNHMLLGSLATPDPAPFLDRLASDLSEESIWAQRVKPTDLSSPLLLPQCCFDAGRHSDLWRRAEDYGDMQNVNGAEKAIRAFELELLRRNDGGPGYPRWIDRRDRVFDHRGERHGAAPFPRNSKYSYRLESGFHYDVSSADRDEFFLKDVDGLRHRVLSRRHINIDPHGYVR